MVEDDCGKWGHVAADVGAEYFMEASSLLVKARSISWLVSHSLISHVSMIASTKAIELLVIKKGINLQALSLPPPSNSYGIFDHAVSHSNTR